MMKEITLELAESLGLVEHPCDAADRMERHLHEMKFMGTDKEYEEARKAAYKRSIEKTMKKYGTNKELLFVSFPEEVIMEAATRKPQ